MARASIGIYVNDLYLRRFGGNKSDVINEEYKYKNMSFEDFYKKHTYFCDTNEVTKDNFKVKISL